MNTNNNKTENDDIDLSYRSVQVIDGGELLDDDSISSGFTEFDEILEKAKIPTLNGLAGRVLDTLQNRAGKSGLSIEEIADEIQLSKRTLQRHLQQENMHFGAIRDSVRFNISIDCLLKKEMTVEETATYLDFADRTSFTYAFKRWANMSPSVFRKLYRDYV